MSWNHLLNRKALWPLAGVVSIVLAGVFIIIGRPNESSVVVESRPNESSVDSANPFKHDKSEVRNRLDNRRNSRPNTNKREQTRGPKNRNLLQDAIENAETPSELADARMEMAKYFAEHDPESGASWLLSIDPAENLVGLIGVFGGEVAKRNDRIWEKVASRFTGIERAAFLRGALVLIGQTDASLAWKKTNEYMATVEGPSNFADEIMTWIIRRNPEQAMNIFDLNASSENARHFFGSAVFSDQTFAVRALNQVTDEKLRGDCFTSYVRSVQSDSLKDLGDALANNPVHSITRDNEISTVISRLYPDDMIAAVDLLNSVKDPEIRSDLSKTIVRYADSKGDRFKERVTELLSGQN